MKRRRLFSTVVVGALIAAQMTMSVMAAPTGSVTADVTTKNAVIRVQVPTKLEVAVDEFATVGDGSQIYSEEFYIKNYSTVPVYVKATSAVTPASTVNALKTTKADAAASEADGKGNAWLAVAAQTESNKYGSGTVGDLTEASANVATVDPAASNTAVQEFYLNKGTGTTYKTVDATSAVPDDVPSYVAEYLPITQLAVAADDAEADGTSTIFNGDTANSGTPAKTNDVILQEQLATNDLYVENQSTGAVTKLTSTDTTATYDSGSNYYTAGAGEGTVTAGKKYVYAETATVGEETAFRFIGKLSTGKTGGWTKADFSTIKIEYDITGVQGSVYDTVKDSCTYGLYKEVEEVKTVTMSTDGVITLTNFDGTKYASLSITDGTEVWPLSDADGEWVWDADDADSVKTFTLGSNWTDFIPGKSLTVTLHLKDGTTIESDEVAIPEA